MPTKLERIRVRQVRSAIGYERRQRATLRGLAYTLDNPDEAFEISKKYVEGLDDSRKNVLEASLDMWRAETLGLMLSTRAPTRSASAGAWSDEREESHHNHL